MTQEIRDFPSPQLLCYLFMDRHIDVKYWELPRIKLGTLHLQLHEAKCSNIYVLIFCHQLSGHTNLLCIFLAS